jgi:hypothetical protein
MLASLPDKTRRAARCPAGVRYSAVDRWSAPRRRSTRPAAASRSASRTAPECERPTIPARTSIELPAAWPWSVTSASAAEPLAAAFASRSASARPRAPSRLASRTDICVTHTYQKSSCEASLCAAARRAEPGIEGGGFGRPGGSSADFVPSGGTNSALELPWPPTTLALPSPAQFARAHAGHRREIELALPSRRGDVAWRRQRCPDVITQTLIQDPAPRFGSSLDRRSQPPRHKAEIRSQRDFRP